MNTLAKEKALCKAACELIDFGFVVYPVKSDKHPVLVAWNTTNAIRDHARAQEFFLNDPKASKADGVGIVCGPSGITPVDVDPKNDGDRTFRKLVHEVGYKVFEDCPQVITPSGGLHCWFRKPDGLSKRTHALGANVLGAGIDIPLSLIAPPSWRNDGVYVWRDGSIPDLSRIPAFPDVLLDRMAKERQRARKVAKDAHAIGTRVPGTIPVTERNQTLMRMAYKLRWRHGYAESELRASLIEMNKRCTVPLEESDLRDMARCIANAPAQSVDPSAWLMAWLPDLRTKQEFRVATTLAMLAEFATGPLTPNAELVKKTSGGMLPENYFRTRAGLEERQMFRVHSRKSKAPFIELLMPKAVSD